MTRPRYLLALDQGTSSSRSIVFDSRGGIVAVAQQEFRQIFPQPGWVEHDPREIWSSQLATAQQALRQAGITAADIAGIGITNQRETTLVWNRSTGEPLCNAIVWQDRRTEPLCAALRERGCEAMLREQTGLVIDAYFSGTKLKWLLDHIPGARDAAAARRTGLRHRRFLADLATDRRRRARHRCQQRLTHPAVRHPSQSLGRRTCWRCWTSRAKSCPRSMPPAMSIGHTRAELFGAPIAIAGIAGDQQARCSARPASAPAWPRTPTAPAASCSCTPASRLPDQHQRADHHQRRANQCDTGIRPRRQRVHRRRRGAMAARRPEGDQGQRCGARPGRDRARQRRRDVRAGLHRPRRALLEARRARRHPRPDPRHHASRTSPAPHWKASPSRARPCCRP